MRGIVLKPKCIIKDENNDVQCLGHSAEGYIIPCCWMNDNRTVFYQEKFKISNNTSIKSITQSKEWIDFYKMLIDEPKKAPHVCHEFCGISSKNDNYGVQNL